jgi:MFS family permease
MLTFGPEAVHELEQAISAAIAPAFLLTGIFSVLNVLVGRLARLVDRERAIREGVSTALADERPRLGQRARCIHRAIVSCVIAAILLCALIVWSFVGTFLRLPVAWVLAALLIAAMASVIAALVYFLKEVRIASIHLPLHADDD